MGHERVPIEVVGGVKLMHLPHKGITYRVMLSEAVKHLNAHGGSHEYILMDDDVEVGCIRIRSRNMGPTKPKEKAND